MDKMISVIIPTYNRKNLTDKAVASVVTAYPSLVEILVVDDCGFHAYSYATLNSSGVPVRVIRLDRNVGAGMARQDGVAHASSSFIAFLDSDDRYDAGWIDYVLTFLQTGSEVLNRQVLITGATKGEKRIGGMVRRMLVGLPQTLQLIATRIVVTLFNPFYTPSVVMSRDLCIFKDGLRHCEDYYSTAFAVFNANNIHFTPMVACHLGRPPNSPGGESSSHKKMFQGELLVRVAMLRNPSVPLGFKLCVPVGMAYQWFRAGVKRILCLIA